MKKLSLFFKTMILALTLIGGITSKGYVAQSLNDGSISGAIFEREGGYFHGALSLSELYSDNIFYTHSNTESDFVTRVTPGVWVMVPGGKERLPETATSSAAPGGMLIRGAESESFRRLRAHLFYCPEFELYAENSDQDSTRHLAEGSVEYNFSGGLSVGLMNQYRKSNDERGQGLTALSLALDKYTTNLYRIFTDYPVSVKLSLEADYSGFYVDYSDARNAFRDRFDSSVSGRFLFHLSSKASIFTEVEYLQISYDRQNFWDGDEIHYFGGFRWRITNKSSGMIKGGWGVKRYDMSGSDETNTMIFQAQIDHRFTGRTGISLSASRRTNESNIATSNYTVTDDIRFAYTQQIRSNIKVGLSLLYSKNSYNDAFETGPVYAGLNEDRYGFSTSLNYAIKKWLTAGIEYKNIRRDANYTDFDYTVNEVLFKINCSL